MDRIDVIDGEDWNVPIATWWEPEMVIDDKDVLLLMHLVHIQFDRLLLVYIGCTIN